MTADGLLQAVRDQLGLGRLLPLGGPPDRVWIAERAAAHVLREAGRAVPGVRLDAVRIGPQGPDGHDWHAVRDANPAAPPGALPAGPWRVDVDFTARPDHPLPRTAELLRAALADTAVRRLGPEPAVIDLRVVGLLDDGSADEPADERLPVGGGVPAADDAVLAAALAVPGVRSAVSRLPGPDVRLEIAVAVGHRALDVALAVHAAVGAAGDGATAVLVTEAG